MLVKDSKIVILMKRGYQHDDEEEKERKKLKDFEKITCFVDSLIRTWAIGSDLCQ
jgi:hypothetical protein